MEKNNADGSFDKPWVLIVGADGMIGRSLRNRLLGASWRVDGTTRRQDPNRGDLLYFDLCDLVSVSNLAEQKYSAIVICAAITSVYLCERHPRRTRDVNVVSTVALASRMLRAGKHVVYLSTSMVFDGEEPLVPADAPLSPVTEYGRQKADVERFLSETGETAAILRLSKVIGREFPLFDRWRRILVEGSVISPCNNKKMAPVGCDMVIDIIKTILENRLVGRFQLSATHDISYADAAIYIADRLGCDRALIRPVSCSPEQVGAIQNATTLAGDSLLRLGYRQPSPFNAINDYIAGFSGALGT